MYRTDCNSLITSCSQCHRSSSLDAFFNDVLQSPPVKLAVIGCGCSVATEPVAEISHRWNISQVYLHEVQSHTCIQGIATYLSEVS